MFYAPPPYR
ncbi:hypothetical protein VCHC02A1_3494, partial [Vibrio cholerae HC-02A1]